MTIRIEVFLAVFLLDFFSRAIGAAPVEAHNRPERLVLTNGITVILHPISGAPRVAVEAIYDAGSFNEPAGIPQFAPFLRHLKVISATNKNNSASRALISSETLATLTHYAWFGDSNELSTLLEMEAQHLGPLDLSQDLIREAVSACYADAAEAEKNPKSGILEEVFAALNQSWRWRTNHARIHSGIESLTPAQINGFHERLYQPANLVLVIVGGFQKDQAALLCQKWFGPFRPSSVAATPIDWTKEAPENVCLWDTKTKAFCMAFPPPPQKIDQILLTLWGTILLPKFTNNPDLKLLADAFHCPNQTWAVGPLPFFLYVTPRTNVSLFSVQRMVQEKSNAFANRKPADSEMAQLHQLAGELGKNPSYTWAAVETQAQILGRQLDENTSQTTGFVLANLALQLGLRDSLLRNAPGAVTTIQKMTADEMHGFLRAYFNPATSIETILLPEERAN